MSGAYASSRTRATVARAGQLPRGGVEWPPGPLLGPRPGGL